ncbi:MAG TPA: MgtC/SapB family protein [Thermoanaerobaculia bacterium]
MDSALVLRLAVALGIGLLVGAERERRKGEGAARNAAGIRTFAIVSLFGGIVALLGGEVLLVAGLLGVAGLAALSYARTNEDDPGLTTEVTLLTTYLLGALASKEPGLAGALAVCVAVLLATRGALHRFVGRILTEHELQDGLLFLAAALVVLPLTPDRPVGPFGVLNPRTIWKLVVLVMAIGAAGYVALRTLGPKTGLPLAGLASGFVSSTATIGALGARARREPVLVLAAVAGATLSTVATVVQLAVALAATSLPTLRAMVLPLVFGGVAAIAWGLLFTVRSLRDKGVAEAAPGRAFDPKVAVAFAATVSAILLASAAVNQMLGPKGLLVAAGLAGFADTHAPAISVASLVAAGKVQAGDAVLPILLAMTTNTVSKIVLAAMAGGRRFALQVVPGLLLVIGAAWAGALLFTPSIVTTIRQLFG